MTLYENMAKFQLEREIEKYTEQLNKAAKAMDKISATTNYSDEVARSFHMGRVGFRKDTKRVNATIDKTLRNATEFCRQNQLRQEAINIIEHCTAVILFIERNSTPETVNSLTKKQIIEQQKKSAISNAKPLEWKKVDGQYVYQDYAVKRVDDVAFIYRNGNMLNYVKTVKEAKAIVSILIAKECA